MNFEGLVLNKDDPEEHFLMFKWDGLNYNAIQDDF